MGRKQNRRKAAQRGVVTQPEPTPQQADTAGQYRWAWAEMAISSLIGLIASLVLSIEAVVLAENAGAELACNLSERISCGSVALSWQASLLGFPNAFLGLIAEPIVLTVAVAGLGGVRFPRWFMLTAQGIYTIGLAFAWWLFAQSYLVIGKLCPWCLLITVTTTLVFTSMTRINLLEGNLGQKAKDKTEGLLAAKADVWGSATIIMIGAFAVWYKYIL